MFTTADGAFQLLLAQGVFRVSLPITQWGIDFISANIETPAVTLHYPTMRQFIREIKKGYKYIGIAFANSTMHKMVPMVEAIRKYTPQSKIILGGYGTALPDEELAPYADYICRGEGVEFMRRLLGEPIDRPFEQPIITSTPHMFSLPLRRTGYLFGSLGCPNGCDFCATSHRFNQKKVMFLSSGREIVDAIKRLRSAYPGLRQFYLSDEDFFVNKERVLQFRDEMRRSGLPPISITGYGSVKVLSQYELSDLIEMGFDFLWIGYEGMRAGYEKMKGRSYKDLFEDLRAHGIGTVASMIIGFDYQTPEIIEEEFNHLMSLKPTMCQFLIYFPFYGTPFYKRLKEEGRLLPDVDADKSKHDITWLCFKHPHMSPEELQSIQMNLYRKEYAALGPSFFRSIENCLDGYVGLRDHDSSRVREKAENYKDLARRALAVIPASRRYLQADAKDWVNDLQERIVAETGPYSSKDKLLSAIAPLFIKATDLRMRYNIATQPRFIRRTYRL